MTIAGNIENVRRRMAEAGNRAGRWPEDVELVTVTKEATVGQIEEAISAGCRVIGENRVQDAVAKYKIIGDRAEWHLIGHLQTNKVKDAVKLFSLIHSVDSLRLAAAIDKEGRRLAKVQDILIEVNTSGEASKFGIAPDGLMALFKKISLYPNINIKGLMTLAPEAADAELARPYFRRLRELFEEIKQFQISDFRFQILSMGMTNDFEVAIEEGATLIRVGRAIFSHD